MEEGLKLLSKEYQRIIVETEDTKEILAEITNQDIKSANNIQIRIMPTYRINTPRKILKKTTNPKYFNEKISLFLGNDIEGSVQKANKEDILSRLTEILEEKKVTDIKIIYENNQH